MGRRDELAHARAVLAILQRRLEADLEEAVRVACAQRRAVSKSRRRKTYPDGRKSES